MKAFIKYYIKDRLSLFQSKLRLRLSKKIPVLVYTMAKVGSLSIYTSIKKQTSIPCFHIHSLNLAENKAARQICFENGVLPDSRSPVPFILNQVIHPNKPCKIISLFRDPVERNISAFFDAFEFYFGVPANRYEGSMKDLIQCYHEKLPHEYPTQWFEQKFERDTGINLYDSEFNAKDGFQFYTNNNFEILLMNSNINNTLKRDLVAEFISEKSFRLFNVNVTAKTNKSKLYKAFKEEIRFDKDYLDTLLQSNYCQHFFTKSDIDSCYAKWLN